jgi:hypothetical protein
MKAKTPSSSLGTTHENVCHDKTNSPANRADDDTETE